MKYLTLALLLAGMSLPAQEKENGQDSSIYNGLKFRNIGPAFASGRIADIAIHPEDGFTWYVAVGSGGVWKTENSGVTWKPIFDNESSYSIGCVSIDPENPSIIWVGTGENVGGRHVGFGDGVYRSENAGKSWKNMGLKNSEHISEIIIHPENSNVIYVAAQGPLWGKGGERGLYRSTDCGSNWEQVLSVNEWTGVTDIAMDPEDPDVMYAAAWQRHRNVAAYMGGGPGSGIYRSKDGGDTWEKLTKGLPGSNMGKIGIGVSPFDRNTLYAAIELDRRTGGVYISRDRGSSWTKQSDAVAGGTGPHYYQELYVSPHYEGTIYLADVRMQVSDDHGKTFRSMKEVRKHSDNHSLTFSKDDPDYLLVGTDGGVYESFDLAENWRYIQNLPITQYYKVAVDDAEPFYYVFGGTQDNGTHGGPSRTDKSEGIRNADWEHILGSDGHQVATEPGNPGIVYGEGQQGWIHRIDRITGEQIFIQPQADEGEPFERFNWDTPILVSPHDPARIYTASYRVWKSDNRGDSWDAISGDLTRDQERIELPIMGRQQSWDNPWDIYAMSTYNTITSISESPVKEGLIYVGTDDGIIQVTENGGKSWRKTEIGSIKGIPANAFVNDIRADLYEEKTVYAALDNHKFGDFKPYLMKSTDAGKNWTLITEGLPDRLIVWRMVQDHVEKDLMFLATEFGIYFTQNGAKSWKPLKGGLPTISFRDITIQRRESDLVAASFGRGFFILDDISPFRAIDEDVLEKEGHIFDVKEALLYIPQSVTVDPGASEYRAKNPPYGAVFTYYFKSDDKTQKEIRKEKEKKLEKEKVDIPFPGWKALDLEKAEEKPFLLFVISDGHGNMVNYLKAEASKGIHRVNWDLRHMSARAIDPDRTNKVSVNSRGYRVTPATYTVAMYLIDNGKARELVTNKEFIVKPLRDGVLTAKSSDEKEAFRAKLEEALFDYYIASDMLVDAKRRTLAMKSACYRLKEDPIELIGEIEKLETQLESIEIAFSGSKVKAEVGEKTDPGPGDRLSVAQNGLATLYGPTENHMRSLDIGIRQLSPLKAQLEELSEDAIPILEKRIKDAGAPLLR